LKNHRSFSPVEEARLLKDIKTHKSGLNRLELYEDLKKSYDKLNDAYGAKKLQQDEAWNLNESCKRKLTLMNEEINNLIRQINEIKLGKFDF
jgi:hypothetical protein